MKRLMSWVVSAAVLCSLLPDLALANPYMSKAPKDQFKKLKKKKPKNRKSPDKRKSPNKRKSPKKRKSPNKRKSPDKRKSPKKRKPVVRAKASEKGPLFKGYKSMTLLGDRLRFRAPGQAFRKARNVGIKGAKDPAPSQREDRVILYSKGKRGEMILMASEMFARYNKSMTKKLTTWWKKRRLRTVTFTEFKTSGSHRVFLMTPKTVNKKTSLIRAAYFMQADKTLQFVAIYGSPETIMRKDKGIPLAMKVLRSLRPGKRRLSMKVGKRFLSTPDPKKKIEVTVPQGYAITTKSGKEKDKSPFRLHRMFKLEPVGSEYPQVMIYIGNKAKMFHLNAPKGKFVLSNMYGSALGRTIKWHKWYMKPQQKGQIIYYMKEFFVDLKLSGSGKTHVIFGFEKKKQAHLEAPLTKMIQSMRVVNTKPSQTK